MFSILHIFYFCFSKIIKQLYIFFLTKKKQVFYLLVLITLLLILENVYLLYLLKHSNISDLSFPFILSKFHFRNSSCFFSSSEISLKNSFILLNSSISTSSSNGINFFIFSKFEPHNPFIFTIHFITSCFSNLVKQANLDNNLVQVPFMFFLKYKKSLYFCKEENQKLTVFQSLAFNVQ